MGASYAGNYVAMIGTRVMGATQLRMMQTRVMGDSYDGTQVMGASYDGNTSDGS